MPARPLQHNIAFNTLLDKAGAQGYITPDDLLEAYPNAGHDQDGLTALLVALRHRGVNVKPADEVDDPETELLSPLSTGEADSVFRAWSAPEESFGDDPVGLYLKETSRVPLLDSDAELRLAVRIEKARKARKRIEVTGSEGAALRRKMEPVLADGQEARDELIKANTRLVVSIAKRYIGNGVPFLDLIQEGNLGLMKAVEKYDYHRGFRFSTYATWWIRQTITRAIADQSRTIRVPVHMADRIRLVYKAERELEQTLGRSPNIEELAAAVGMSTIKVQWALKISQQPISLESPMGEDEESELGQFIEDESTPTPAQSAYQSMLRDKLKEALDELSPREARVLRLRFGLDDGNEYTLEEVGQKFGLTRERIRQIEGGALRRLRNPRRARELKEYL